jgi:acetyl-CoA acetyltransferase
VGPPELTRDTARQAAAFAVAGCSPSDVDIVRVHEAFAIEEIRYYELLGFCGDGEADELVEQGAFGPGSRTRLGLPEFSTDGGPITRGHPGAPTGMAQIWETVRHLCEPSGVNVGVCHLRGGGSVCVVPVYERPEW